VPAPDPRRDGSSSGQERIVFLVRADNISIGGNPAMVLRMRFSDEDVEQLLRTAWWDWPVELVTEHARTIMAGSPFRSRPWRERTA
jgi:hypothetical protein